MNVVDHAMVILAGHTSRATGLSLEELGKLLDEQLEEVCLAKGGYMEQGVLAQLVVERMNWSWWRKLGWFLKYGWW